MTEQTLEDLELAFGSVSDTPARPPSGHSDEVTDRYEQRVDSLVTAEGGKWGAALDGQHTYQSDSEAVMAVIGAMVARHFTNGEIERTLEDSYILSSRVERKGEHGRELIPSEIAKARQKVTPLEEDPGAPSIAARIGRKRHASQAGMDSLNSLNSLFSFGDPCKSWPTLGKDALYGPAGEIVNKIDPHTEADPAVILINALISLGSLVGRGAHAVVEGDEHYLNEYAVIVGETSKGRKDTGRGRVRRLCEGVDPVWSTECQVSGLSSGEGLIYAVRDPVIAMKKGQQEIVDKGVSDKRLLVIESEFASVLKVASREGNTLSPVLRQGWDHGNLGVMTRNNPLRATDAHISIIGHITMEELRRYLNETEAGNGFANRFLLALARRSKVLPEGGGWPDLTAERNQLLRAAEFAKEHQQIHRDTKARELWAEVYPSLSAGQPGLYGAVTSRAEAHVLRLSVLYSVLDGSEMVRLPHLKAALALWRYCDASARYIFGDATGDPVADRIIDALTTCPQGLTRTEMHKLFANNLPTGRIDAALMTLLTARRVGREQDSPNGRTKEVWKLLSDENNEFNEN